MLVEEGLITFFLEEDEDEDEEGVVEDDCDGDDGKEDDEDVEGEDVVVSFLACFFSFLGAALVLFIFGASSLDKNPAGI
ncbi:MAG: hypothetical protein ACJAT4_003097, partial [Granulosicoccus sp.]